MAQRYYIENLPRKVGDQELRHLMENYGSPRWVQVLRDPDGKSRGIAVIEMKNRHTTIEELDGREWEGANLIVGHIEREARAHLKYGRQHYTAGDRRMHHL
ncbi:MAG: hypothetical protein GF401_09380 [Chitinivibrionales bacterium]|nr:hypothetical protein [Chitinivibrionales bacterium]